MFKEDEKQYIQRVIIQDIARIKIKLIDTKNSIIRLILSPLIAKAEKLRQEDEEAKAEAQKAKELEAQAREQARQAKELDKRNTEGFLAWINRPKTGKVPKYYKQASHHANLQARNAGGKFTKKQ